MSALGIIGMVFGLIAFTQISPLSERVSVLEKEVKELKEKLEKNSKGQPEGDKELNMLEDSLTVDENTDNLDIDQEEW